MTNGWGSPIALNASAAGCRDDWRLASITTSSTGRARVVVVVVVVVVIVVFRIDRAGREKTAGVAAAVVKDADMVGRMVGWLVVNCGWGG